MVLVQKIEKSGDNRRSWRVLLSCAYLNWVPGFNSKVGSEGVVSSHTYKQFSDTSMVSKSSTLFWHHLLWERPSFHRLRVQSNMNALLPNTPTHIHNSDFDWKPRLLPVLLAIGWRFPRPVTWVQFTCQNGSHNSRKLTYWLDYHLLQRILKVSNHEPEEEIHRHIGQGPEQRIFCSCGA